MALRSSYLSTSTEGCHYPNKWPDCHGHTHIPAMSLSHHAHLLPLCHPQVAGWPCLTLIFCSLKSGSCEGDMGGNDLVVWGLGLGGYHPIHTQPCTPPTPLIDYQTWLSISIL